MTYGVSEMPVKPETKTSVGNEKYLLAGVVVVVVLLLLCIILQ